MTWYTLETKTEDIICCEVCPSHTAYPFGGWYSQTVLLRVEATDLADLCDEVDVFLVLWLLTLASLVFPVEIKKTAGQDEVPAAVRRPAARTKTKFKKMLAINSSAVNVLSLGATFVRSTDNNPGSTSPPSGHLQKWHTGKLKCSTHTHSHTHIFTCP